MENHSAEADDENDLHQVGQIIYREGEENISDDDDVRDYEDEWEEEDDDDEYLHPPGKKHPSSPQKSNFKLLM